MGRQRFVWTKAYVDSKNAVVHADKIEAPQAITYNWENFPDGNRCNKEKLSAVPFRTDGW